MRSSKFVSSGYCRQLVPSYRDRIIELLTVFPGILLEHGAKTLQYRQKMNQGRGKESAKTLTRSEYLALAEFRYQIRRYLRYMERKARARGYNPQQYQLLLAIEGLPEGQIPTIKVVAERMQLNHNTTVELVDRCVERGLLHRQRAGLDRRVVTLVPTSEGKRMMHEQASASRAELQEIGPILFESLQRLTSKDRKSQAKSNELRARGKDGSS